MPPRTVTEIREGDPQAPTEPMESGGESSKKGKVNYYCLEPSHASDLISEQRFFFYDHPVVAKVKGPEGRTVNVLAQDCPVCDTCVDRLGQPKQVSAVPVDYDEDDNPVIPAGILALAERLS